ncbi:MAG TPA: prephenate dehydrogenase/arogenate dehydrogenase family protein [Bacteroidetes bacterium]|nr:prephenate dehydrogenase/arogenate dehydrogenase family protein [Bacteroidota bacterium]
MKKLSRTDSPFRRITIIGVGVIGGSLGLAIKKRFRSVVITGIDRPDVLRKALRRGAIDVASRQLKKTVADADLVFLATPISVILKLLPQVACAIGAGAVVTDVGSVKRGIIQSARKHFLHGTFVGGHPMAGVELSGVEAAHPLLFENAVYVLTPLTRRPGAAVKRFAKFLEELGARVVTLDPKLHDEIVSVVSHVPQLTAVALTNVAGNRHHSSPAYLRLAAGGFRDLTRIASSRPEIWHDILAFNRDEIGRALDLMISELLSYRRALRAKGKPFARMFNEARRIRSRIPKSMKGFLYPLKEVYVFVEDQPGMLAKLTVSLTRAKINIKDLELMKIREGRGGTFRLAFESREVAARAVGVLQKAGFEIGN